MAEALLGRPAADLLGKKLREEYPGTLGTSFERNYRRAVAEQAAVAFQEYFEPHDRWYEGHAYPSPEGLSVYLRDVSDRVHAEERERRLRAEAAEADAKFRAFPSPEGLSVYLRDVSDRVHAEERERRLRAEAAEADAKFRAFFDQGALFAGMMAVDGTVLEFNRLAIDASGFTRAQLLGRPFWDVPAWGGSAELSDQVRQGSLQAAGGRAFRAELPYFTADGQERLVDLNILPIKDEAGRVAFLAPTSPIGSGPRSPSCGARPGSATPPTPCPRSSGSPSPTAPSSSTTSAGTSIPA